MMKDYIAHRRSGLHYETKAPHKYVKRVETGNKKQPYIYFYTWDEYRAYLKTGKVPSNQNSKTISSSSPKSNTNHQTKATSPQKQKSVLNKLKDVLDKAISDFKKVVDTDGNGRWDLIDKLDKKEEPKSQPKQPPKTPKQQVKEETPVQETKKYRNIDRRELNARKDLALQELRDRDSRKLAADKRRRGLANSLDERRDAFKEGRNNRDANKTKQKEYGHDKPPKNHKYIAKLLIKGKFRYFYTQAELEAYYASNTAAEKEREIMSDFDLITDAKDPFEDAAEINKNYEVDVVDGLDREPGWSNNCYDCTLAYEARQRGYDVEAMYDPNGETIAMQSAFYEGVKPATYIAEDGNEYFDPTSGWDNAAQYRIDKGEKLPYAMDGLTTMVDTADMIKDKYPEGARGNLAILWNGGGGHSVAWEIEDGDVYIIDAQNHTKEKMSEYSCANNVANNQAFVLRTDDKKFTIEAANYLQPNDNVDEAKGKDKVTVTDYDIDTAYDMMNNWDDKYQSFVAKNEKQRKRWTDYQDKMSEIANNEVWNHEKVKDYVYNQEDKNMG